MTNRKSPKVTATQLRRREERKKALQLRIAGATYREIAEAVGCSVSVAKDRVETALMDVDRVERQELRELEVQRLDRLQRAVWPGAVKGDLGSVDRAVRIIDRRVKLLGLDAPQQMEVSGAVDVDLEGTVQRIMEAAALEARSGELEV